VPPGRWLLLSPARSSACGRPSTEAAYRSLESDQPVRCPKCPAYPEAFLGCTCSSETLARGKTCRSPSRCRLSSQPQGPGQNVRRVLLMAVNALSCDPVPVPKSRECRDKLGGTGSLGSYWPPGAAGIRMSVAVSGFRVDMSNTAGSEDEFHR
jgi:hypothetical protein